jgi:hypothetical protein
MDVLPWLLDSDPAIRWQVLRDLVGAFERARIAILRIFNVNLCPTIGCTMKTTEKKPTEVPHNLHAELLFETAPQIDHSLIRDHLSIITNAELISGKDHSDLFLIAHQNHVVELKDAKKVALATAILKGDPTKPGPSPSATTAAGQTWEWPEAKQVLARSTHQMLITEMFGGLFQPADRVSAFHSILRMMVELTRPIGIHCHHAERLLDPARVLKASGKTNSVEQMEAFINVRLFRIENQQPGDMLMDTRGLATLGLPDLQIHFRNLNPGKVASVLYNSAMHIYGAGDCINDGETIQGINPDDKWRCQHEDALVGPKRLVLDLDPGDPFAAGQRQRHR